MSPMRPPIRLPKMMKYNVAVIAGGTMVWPQMRMMRLNSRMTMVLKPTILVFNSLGSWVAGPRAEVSTALSMSRLLLVHQADEQLFQPVALVAHGQHLDARCRQLRKNVVQALVL